MLGKSMLKMKNTPAVVDLFAGAGGLSLGAARAGFRVAGAVEIDKEANETHLKNFPNAVHIARDISTLSGRDLISLCGLKPGELSGLIGGPPCQGFSVIGKQNPLDGRNRLLGHFMRLVKEIKPAFFVAENVPGILLGRNVDVLDEALGLVPKSYVIMAAHKVEAQRFGAPTTRKRMFFIGFDPTRVRALSAELLNEAEVKVRTTVRQALDGLPRRISPAWQSEEDGWRVAKKLPPGYFNDRAQACIPQGVGDLDAIRRYAEKGFTSGNLGTTHAPEIAARYGALKHGEMDMASRSVRLNPDHYCPTLRAGTGADKGRFQAVRPIHPSVARVITPREAARLQGFPDWFVLHRTKWHSFRQIGNSVSPMVAEAVLNRIHQQLVS